MQNRTSPILTFAVLFIGGGIPAALPMMFTISQSKGATDLSKRNILVTKLDSIENAVLREHIEKYGQSLFLVDGAP